MIVNVFGHWINPEKILRIRNAYEHNLKDIDYEKIAAVIEWADDVSENLIVFNFSADDVGNEINRQVKINVKNLMNELDEAIEQANNGETISLDLESLEEEHKPLKVR